MPTRTGSYQVQDGLDVLLSVVVGEGQLGHTVVFLGPEKVLSRKEVRRFALGDGGELRGAVLVINTLVVDLAAHHDRTSVLVTLEDGETREYAQSRTATENGTVSYLTVITFT